jgi:catechol 2,3-dioxygenase-like lactoylglutathione lyase family enzyme
MSSSQTELTLDHVALVVSDLDRASEIYSRMGFTLSPRSSHKGRLEPDGPVEPWGTGNHCAMFATGYLEILGITDKERHSEHVQVLLDEYEGLHLIALGCAEAEAEADNIRHRLGKGAEPYTVSRDVPMTDGSSKQATFNILQLPDESFPEADLFLIEHRNKDVIWQPDMLSQPNGVVGLSEVIVCSDDIQDTAGRLSAALGISPTGGNDTLVFELARGTIKIITPDALGVLCVDIQPPKLPWVAAVEFLTADTGATGKYLQENGFKVRQMRDDSVWIDATQADGAVVIFSRAE